VPAYPSFDLTDRGPDHPPAIVVGYATAPDHASARDATS